MKGGTQEQPFRFQVRTDQIKNQAYQRSRSGQEQYQDQPIKFQIRTDDQLEKQTSYLRRSVQSPHPPTEYMKKSNILKNSERRTEINQQLFKNPQQNDGVQKQFDLNINSLSNKYNMTSSLFAESSQIKKTGFKTSRSVKYPNPSYNATYKYSRIQKGYNDGQELNRGKQGISEAGNTVRYNQTDYFQILSKSQKTISDLQQVIRNLKRGNQSVEEVKVKSPSSKAKNEFVQRSDPLVQIQNLLSMIQSNRLRASSSSRRNFHVFQSTELRQSRREADMKVQLEATVSNLTVDIQRLEWQNRQLLTANQKLIHIIKRARYQEDNAASLQKCSRYEEQITKLKTLIKNLTQELEKVEAEYEEVHNSYRQYIEAANNQPTQSQKYQYEQIVETYRLQNQQLSRMISFLQDENQLLKGHISQIKNSQVQTSQPRHQQDIVSRYTSEIEQLKSTYEKRIVELNQKIQLFQSRQIQIRDYRQNENSDVQNKIKLAISLFQKQIETLRSINAQQTAQIHSLNQEKDRINNQLTEIKIINTELNTSIKFISQENENIKLQCSNFEKHVSSLNAEIERLQAIIKGLQGQKWQLQEVKIRLEEQLIRIRIEVGRYEDAVKTIDQLKINVSNFEKVNMQLQFKFQQVNNRLLGQQKLHNEQITILQQEISFKNQQISILNQRVADSENTIVDKSKQIQKWYALYQKISNDKASLTLQTIEEELKDLKASLDQFDLKRISKFQIETIEEYYRLMSQHELKIEENLKMKSEIEELKQQIMLQKRSTLQLNQRISSLQGSLEIYQRQLKQKKTVYEQLLQEKVRIEKEVFLCKKIKVQKSNIEQEFKVSVGQIASRIDHVLDLERKRTYKWKQFDRPA